MITAGEVLKKKRESLGKSLSIAAQDTKIQKRFLQYIENDDFSQFDSEVFLTGFIKIYSKYLTLDTEKILALYRRSHPTKDIKTKNTKKNIFNIKKISLTPKNIITFLSIIFFVLILGYIGLQIYKFQTPPTLTITSPEDNITTETATILIQGKTQPDATLEINKTLVDVDNEGTFSKEIPLVDGINLITIKASKNSNSIQETVKTLKITYSPAQVAPVPEETTKTFTLKLTVKGAASWIKLDIDGKNKLSQTVQPSTQTYTVTDNFSIITGKAANTTVYINDEPLPWSTNSTTGVAEINCQIKDQALSCE